ncbi:MAG: hypothetical protein COA58_05235 [Bacteroidetes bacterium]|nr:MAG: hypothetical protein COA58_05235 [Bacteroidota bacterium]
MNDLSIAIVDDHILFADALKEVLPVNSTIATAITFSRGEDLLTHFESDSVDLVLLDVGIKNGKSGFEILKEIKYRRPHIKVIMLSMHTQRKYVNTAKELGANGYLIKESSAQDLKKAIDKVARGCDFYTDHEFNEPNKLDILSKSEYEIAELLIQGKSSKEIAEETFRSKETIDTHRKNIYRKLEINGIVDLLRLGVKHGMILDNSM